MGKLLLGSLGVSLLAFACGGGGSANTGPATAATVMAPCHDDCVHRVSCQDPTSTRTVEECTADCTMELGGGWIRQDVVDEVLACSAMLACGMGDDSCLDMVDPLQVHRDWEVKCRAQLLACDTNIESLCEVDPVATQGDAGIVRIFAPVVVREMIACLDAADCTARMACIEGVFTKYMINL